MPLALMPAGRATGPRSAVERSRSAARSWGMEAVRPRSRPQRATGQGLPAGLHATPLFTWTFSVGEGGLNPRPPAPKAGNELLLRTSISM